MDKCQICGAFAEQTILCNKHYDKLSNPALGCQCDNIKCDCKDYVHCDCDVE